MELQIIALKEGFSVFLEALGAEFVRLRDQFKTWVFRTFTAKRLIASQLLVKLAALVLFAGVIQNGQVAVSVNAGAVAIELGKVQPIGEQVQTVNFAWAESAYDIRERELRAAAAATKSRSVVVRERPAFSGDPGFEAKRALAQRAAGAFGIPWQLLEAVWQVESGKSWDTNRRSYAGATGPMQFLPSTFRKYAIDGNGDGQAQIWKAEDAVFAAAKLLSSAGAANDPHRALFAYNHSTAYVAKVLRVVRSIGYDG